MYDNTSAKQQKCTGCESKFVLWTDSECIASFSMRTADSALHWQTIKKYETSEPLQFQVKPFKITSSVRMHLTVQQFMRIVCFGHGQSSCYK